MNSYINMIFFMVVNSFIYSHHEFMYEFMHDFMIMNS